MVVTKEKVESLLTAKLVPSHLAVTDISGGCGASFEVEIVSSKFEGKRLLERHRMVNDALKEVLGDIHALSITKAQKPDSPTPPIKPQQEAQKPDSPKLPINPEREAQKPDSANPPKPQQEAQKPDSPKPPIEPQQEAQKTDSPTPPIKPQREAQKSDSSKPPIEAQQEAQKTDSPQ
ncbi:unnamed protein product [Cuscuta europaea]|uniref:Uncharacterized protein n=1 Tax=Cuscuta europaea TaxID=41803 RepID=A0A9P0ZP74_CUSEU|nr:unnamed protein product [Cuscuta europaea]